jgi:hypothetical protein
MKVICQNCFEILAERNTNENYFKYDSDKVESILQKPSEDAYILTFACPKCGCMLQVKV